MELNKYDLVEWLISNWRFIHCYFCPIRKECEDREQEIGHIDFVCHDKEKTKEILNKKYNL